MDLRHTPKFRPSDVDALATQQEVEKASLPGLTQLVLKVIKLRWPLVQGFAARSRKVPAKSCTSFFVCALCLWAAEKFITRQSG